MCLSFIFKLSLSADIILFPALLPHSECSLEVQLQFLAYSLKLSQRVNKALWLKPAEDHLYSWELIVSQPASSGELEIFNI